MADLSDLQAAQLVKLVGSDPTGVETTPVGSSALGELRTVQILSSGGVQGVITVGITAIEAKVGGSRHANRKLLTVYNNGVTAIYWGYTSGVTDANGTPILRNQLASWNIGDAPIYLIATISNTDVRVTEGA